MTTLDRYRKSIDALCRQYRVGRLDLVGSAARGDFDASRSDYDFLVEFLPETTTRALDVYFGFKERLEALLGRPVDLIVCRRGNESVRPRRPGKHAPTLVCGVTPRAALGYPRA